MWPTRALLMHLLENRTLFRTAARTKTKTFKDVGASNTPKVFESEHLAPACAWVSTRRGFGRIQYNFAFKNIKK